MTATIATASQRIARRGLGYVPVALVVASVAYVAAVRSAGPLERAPDAPVSIARTLVFADRVDGGIDVVDANSRTLVETVRGEAGFVRGTLRGFARERRRAGIGADTPFELVAHIDGRLTLVDPATARRVDLESFGPTNLADFARMLPQRSASSVRSAT